MELLLALVGIVVLAGVGVLGWYTWNCWPMIRQNFPWLGEESSS